MKNKLTSIFALGLLLTAALACEFSATTANLSDVKLAVDESASDPKTTFDSDDEIFAVTALNNTSATHKIKFRLLFDDVEGAESGTIAYKLEKEMEIEGSRSFWYTFSVPGSGFVPGKYKVEFALMDEKGEKEIDKKTATFTVTGSKNRPDADKSDSSDDTDDN